MSKSEKIRRIYSIVLSVFIVAMGVALICVAADIYYSGEGPGKYYSREIVGDRLEKLAIPLLILIAAIIAGAIFPIWEAKGKNVWTSEATLKKLERRIPANGEGKEFAEAKKAYRDMKIAKIISWCSALAVALVGAIVTLVYLADAAHFKGTDFSGHILNLVKTALPWTVTALAVFCAATILNSYFSKAQIGYIKKMIRYGSREIAVPKEFELLDKMTKVASHDITLWVVRGVVFVLAVTFIIVGVLNGGAHDVLVKATQICQECIGIG